MLWKLHKDHGRSLHKTPANYEKSRVSVHSCPFIQQKLPG